MIDIYFEGCITRVSRDYNGTWSQTKFGRPCQRWDSQSPHTHNQTNPSDFPLDTSVFDAHNYCRDPRNEGESLLLYTTCSGSIIIFKEV